jgi:DNA replication protein DnaC
MIKALEEQINMPDSQTLSFDERLGLMVDLEMIERENRRLNTRLKKAKLRYGACLEDLDYRQKRGLDKSLVLSLASCQWIAEHLNLIITGPTGVGKSYIACAMGHKACLEGFTTLYKRLPAMLLEMTVAKADGSYPKLMAAYAKTSLLIIDDWGLEKVTKEHSLDLLELLEDRYGSRSTLVTAQIPVNLWHENITDPTLADAILDRLVHNAYKVNLKGESMRKKLSPLTQNQKPE